MIVSSLSEPLLRGALRRAARPDEDVVCSADLVDEALLRGFPRLVVREDDRGPALQRRGGPAFRRRARSVHAGGPVPELVVTRGMLQRWERQRKRMSVLRPRVEFVGDRLSGAIRDRSDAPGWVDRTLGDLSRTSGAALPDPFRGLARRVLEFPSHYVDLFALEALTGLSRGALKARFRRRGLASPTSWLRRLRVVAGAHLLSRPSTTTLEAAYRLGFSDSGNFCRLVREAGGMSPTEVREPAGRARLVLGLAEELARPRCRERWESLGTLFVAEVA